MSNIIYHLLRGVSRLPLTLLFSSNSCQLEVFQKRIFAFFFVFFIFKNTLLVNHIPVLLTLFFTLIVLFSNFCSTMTQASYLVVEKNSLLDWAKLHKGELCSKLITRNEKIGDVANFVTSGIQSKKLKEDVDLGLIYCYNENNKEILIYHSLVMDFVAAVKVERVSKNMKKFVHLQNPSKLIFFLNFFFFWFFKFFFGFL